MRELVPLLFFAAMLAPPGRGDAFPSVADEGCNLVEAIRSTRRPGEGDPRGPGLMARYGLAAPAPAEGSTGWTDGPRREITVLPRRIAAPAIHAALERPAGDGLRAPRRLARSATLRAFPAHPSTAPPRIA